MALQRRLLLFGYRDLASDGSCNAIDGEAADVHCADEALAGLPHFAFL